MKVASDANDERKVESGNPDTPEHESNLDALQQKDHRRLKGFLVHLLQTQKSAPGNLRLMADCLLLDTRESFCWAARAYIYYRQLACSQVFHPVGE